MKDTAVLYKPNDKIPLWGAFKGDGLVVDLTVNPHYTPRSAARFAPRLFHFALPQDDDHEGP